MLELVEGEKKYLFGVGLGQLLLFVLYCTPSPFSWPGKHFSLQEVKVAARAMWKDCVDHHGQRHELSLAPPLVISETCVLRWEFTQSTLLLGSLERASVLYCAKRAPSSVLQYTLTEMILMNR